MHSRYATILRTWSKNKFVVNLKDFLIQTKVRWIIPRNDMNSRLIALPREEFQVSDNSQMVRIFWSRMLWNMVGGRQNGTVSHISEKTCSTPLLWKDPTQHWRMVTRQLSDIMHNFALGQNQWVGSHAWSESFRRETQKFFPPGCIPNNRSRMTKTLASTSRQRGVYQKSSYPKRLKH